MGLSLKYRPVIKAKSNNFCTVFIGKSKVGYYVLPERGSRQ